MWGVVQFSYLCYKLLLHMTFRHIMKCLWSKVVSKQNKIFNKICSFHSGEDFWCGQLVASPYTRWFKYDRDWCGLFTHKSVPVIYEPPCILIFKFLDSNLDDRRLRLYTSRNIRRCFPRLFPYIDGYFTFTPTLKTSKYFNQQTFPSFFLLAT